MMRSRWLFLFIVAGMTVWMACPPDDVRVVAPRARFQCPDSSISITVIGKDKNGQDSVIAQFDDIPLSHPIAQIPEFHDCQRFIDSSHFTSVFAIFAAFRLDTVTSPPGPVGSKPMATIYTPDGSYGPLGIETGFNCLFLERHGSNWTAKMIPWGIDRSNCADGHITPGPGVGTDLAVRQQNVSTEFTARDFPPVARWDRDSLDRDYTIGIRCGSAWCEVGAPGFAPSIGYQGPPLTFDAIGGRTPSPVAQHRVVQIKGWYDVQRLALGGSAAPQTPTAFRGFLIPHPFLDSLAWLKWQSSATAALNLYRDLGWIHIGYAVMEGNYPKWNFQSGRNKIYLCYGKRTEKCIIPGNPSPEAPSSTSLAMCPADPAATDLHWWAKTVSETGNTTYVCIKRMNHRDALMAWAGAPENANVSFSIPGAARWRFLPVDDASWFGCPTGCCTKM